MSHLALSQKSYQIGTEFLGLSLVRPMLVEAPKVEEIVEKSRAKAKSVLEDETDDLPPVDPGSPVRHVERESLIQNLNLEVQYSERMDTIIELIARGVFELKAPELTCEAVLKTFTLDQLRIASGYQEPTLLIVPETSFRAKVAAINMAVKIAKERVAAVLKGGEVSRAVKRKAAEIGKWDNARLDDPKWLFGKDRGSKKIVGWEAVIVDGANKIDPKAMGDEVELSIGERMKNRMGARRHGEAGMDRQIYSMLALEAILRGKPIGWNAVKKDWRYTILDDNPINSSLRVRFPRISYVAWFPKYRQVYFYWGYAEDKRELGRFRRSIGGKVEP